MKRLLSTILAGTILLSCASVMSSCGKDDKIKLYFDGGGGSGDYNSSLIMTPSEANPNPYNTLEKLAKEWNKTNDKYEVVINRTSLRGNRVAVTSMLQAKTAPDMLYQVGNVLNDDLGNNWYNDLTEYLNKPNPYIENNEKWSDIYNGGAEASKAEDGKIYYVCLDQVPLGMMYNMELLNKAGINQVPTTYSEFLTVLDTLESAKQDGTIDAEVYIHQGLWQEAYLMNSVYASSVSEWDLDNDKMVSSYELAKAYYDGEWSYSDEQFVEFLNLLYAKAEHYPTNYLAYDTATKFARGELCITDGIGNNMRIAERRLGEDLVVTGYPMLDENASKYGGNTVVRGSAGLSTSYWVTNSATEKGQGAVDACADFLMFLSAPQNNSRMVNDLGYALPIDPSLNTTKIFNDLSTQYEQDVKANATKWGSCLLYQSFGLEFSDTFDRSMGKFYESKDKEGDTQYIIDILNQGLPNALTNMKDKFNWEF